MKRNDYQAFAGSFLDLWQEQIARAMSDTDFLQAIMENMQEMQSGMFGYDAAHKDHQYAAHASEPEPDELDDMRRRLATAERKIIKLEARIERLKDKPEPKKKPAAKAAKPAAKRAAAKPKAVAVAKPKPKSAAKKPAARKRAVKRK